MKVKINTEIDLGCLFDAAHSQKEIHAMLEYLIPHAADDTIVNAVIDRGIVDGVINEACKQYGVRDIQRIKNVLEQHILDWCKENNVTNTEDYL